MKLTVKNGFYDLNGELADGAPCECDVPRAKTYPQDNSAVDDARLLLPSTPRPLANPQDNSAVDDAQVPLPSTPRSLAGLVFSHVLSCLRPGCPACAHVLRHAAELAHHEPEGRDAVTALLSHEPKGCDAVTAPISHSSLCRMRQEVAWALLPDAAEVACHPSGCRAIHAALTHCDEEDSGDLAARLLDTGVGHRQRLLSTEDGRCLIDLAAQQQSRLAHRREREALGKLDREIDRLVEVYGRGIAQEELNRLARDYGQGIPELHDMMRRVAFGAPARPW